MLVVVTEYFLPLVGGMEISTYRLIKELAEQGVFSTIITRKHNTFMLDVETFDNFTVYRYTDLYREAELFLSKKYSVNAVYVIGFSPQEPEEQLLFISRIKSTFDYTIFFKIPTTEDVKNYLQKYTERVLLFNRYVDYVFVLNKSIKLELQQIGFDVDCLIDFFNGIKIEQQSVNIIDNKLKFLSIGRFVKRKGFIDLLNAFYHLQDANVALTVIGYDDNRFGSSAYKEMVDLIKLYKLKNISLITNEGYVSKEYYQDANMIIIPSYKEGMPNVLIESFSYGRPVIGRNISGINEYICHWTCLVEFCS